MESVIDRFAKGSRKDALSLLRTEAFAVDVSHDVSFQDIFSMCPSLLEMSDREIADGLLVSRPTVSRWVRGKNLPHRAMRKSIFDWIASQAARRLRVLDAEDRRTFVGPAVPVPGARVARAR